MLRLSYKVIIGGGYYMLRYSAITIFACGLLVAGSEGPFFPWVNIAGTILMFVGAGLLSRLNDRGLL